MQQPPGSPGDPPRRSNRSASVGHDYRSSRQRPDEIEQCKYDRDPGGSAGPAAGAFIATEQERYRLDLGGCVPSWPLA
jgi:hypothetical protein